MVIHERRAAAGERERIAGVDRNVFLLSVVSFFADVSSEMIYPLIPLFLTQTLGAPAAALGLVEGVAESTASLLKVVSGWLSDRLGRRKPLVVLGYGLSALGKPALALAGAWPLALVARAIDRTGKGLRDAPRDALIAGWTPPEERGRAFGFHRALDTAGAVLGPLVALLGLWLLRDNLRLLFLLAVVPAAMTLLVLAPVRDRRPERPAERPPISLRLAGASPDLRGLLLVILVFGLGNSSDTFLLLRARYLGLGTTAVVLAYVLYNVVYAGLALPAGIRSDRVGRRNVMLVGLLVFSAVYLGFAVAPGPALVWPLFAVYGAYIALTDGVGKALVADLAPRERQATALGLYSTVVGLSALVASVVAGLLWDAVGPAAPFVYGAALAALAAGLLWRLLPARSVA
ncbi:MAG: MFS transporter [Thermomicrobiaceae bacterium]|nr:MFS transporter [Thermomicrobiaceae bacterium]